MNVRFLCLNTPILIKAKITLKFKFFLFVHFLMKINIFLEWIGNHTIIEIIRLDLISFFCAGSRSTECQNPAENLAGDVHIPWFLLYNVHLCRDNN